jgi:hypothetical protein
VALLFKLVQPVQIPQRGKARSVRVQAFANVSIRPMLQAVRQLLILIFFDFPPPEE